MKSQMTLTADIFSFILRQGALLFLHRLRDSAVLRPCEESFPAPSHSRSDAFEYLCRVTENDEFLLHASTTRIEGMLEPRTQCDEARLLFATDNPLFAFCHAIAPIWAASIAKDGNGEPLSPIAHGGLYRFASRNGITAYSSFLSLHKNLEIAVDLDREVFIYVCPSRRFRLRKRGKVTSWTHGKVRSTSEWVTDRPIEPHAVIRLSLMDLPCPVARHHSGTSFLQALLQFRTTREAAAKAHG
jgi:hypothetical protein